MESTESGGGVRKSVRTRARILEAAAEVLASKGYAATRLGDIAQVAEVRAPAIYYYFESKDDLVEEVMRKGTAQTREFVEQRLAALGPGLPVNERIDVAVTAHLESVLQTAKFALAAIRNAEQVPQDVRLMQEREQRRYDEMWRRLLEEARAAGVVAPDADIEVLHVLLVGGLNHVPASGLLDSRSFDDVVAHCRVFARSALSGSHRSEPAARV